jgi:hypothetical protein
MGGRLEADDLRAEEDRIVVFIVRQMIDTGFDRHAPACSPVIPVSLCNANPESKRHLT